MKLKENSFDIDNKKPYLQIRSWYILELVDIVLLDGASLLDEVLVALAEVQSFLRVISYVVKLILGKGETDWISSYYNIR